MNSCMVVNSVNVVVTAAAVDAVAAEEVRRDREGCIVASSF